MQQTIIIAIALISVIFIIVLSAKQECKTTEWGDWSACNSGLRQRTSNCGAIETENCSMQTCTVGPWSAWSCNNGKKTRTRTVTGANCPHTKEEAACDPVPCEVSAWSPWNCVNEIRKRFRTIVKPPLWGGSCPHLEETAECKSVNCVLGGWIPNGTSICPAMPKMVDSIQEMRQVLVEPEYAGTKCGDDRYRKSGCPLSSIYGAVGPFYDTADASNYTNKEVGLTFNVATASKLQGMRYLRRQNAQIQQQREIRVYENGNLIHTGFVSEPAITGNIWVQYMIPGDINLIPGNVYHVTYLHLSGSLPWLSRNTAFINSTKPLLTEVYGVFGNIDAPTTNPTYTYAVDIFIKAGLIPNGI